MGINWNSEESLKGELERIGKIVKKKMINWRGYDHPSVRTKKVYSINLTENQFKKLWKRFLEWEGSQEDFYFRFVNPMHFSEIIELNSKRGKIIE